MNDLNGIAPDILRYVMFIMIAIALSVCGRVFITLAVGEDAKVIGVKNRTLWMVLSFILPVFALIYLGVRNTLEKNVMRMCLNCGATMPPNTKMCYNCSGTVLADYRLADEQYHKDKRQKYVIAGIILVFCGAMLSSYASVNLTNNIIKKYGNNYNSGGYSDFFNDFPDYNSGGDKNDDDLFDDFNNFGNGE